MPKIFISYSHRDTPCKDQLVTHLRVLQHQGLVETWDDQHIRPGEDWKAEIGRALEAAGAAVLLVSADFLASEFILREEIPLLLQKRAAEGLRIFPVLIRPCAWQSVPWLNDMQLIQANPDNLDQTFAELAQQFSQWAQPVGEELQQGAAAYGTSAGFSFNKSLPVYVDIEKQRGKHIGTVHQGNVQESHRLPELGLDNNLKVSDKHPWTLEQLLDKTGAFDLAGLDERLQLALGQYLFDQTIGRLPQKQQQQLLETRSLDLRILADDEWALRLPWQLLANKGIFRSAAGWSVSLGAQAGDKECRLPASPKILIAAPEPSNAPKTDAASHLEQLEDLLASSNRLLTRGNHIRVAANWKEFDQFMRDFQPDIVYFYGNVHCENGQARLLFAHADNRQAEKISLSELGQCLRRAARAPLLVYLNACSGHKPALIEEARLMCDAAPTVVVNRVALPVGVLQNQAQSLLQQIVTQAIAPSQAITNLYLQLDNLSAADIRWTIPVLFNHYRSWEANAPAAPDRLSTDPNWHLKIDRVTQYSTVMAQTRLMLREQKPKSLIFSWYGQEGQGIEIFHKRLLVELREDLQNTFVYQVRPAWPLHLDNYHTSFSDIMMQAFEVNSLEDIPARIRAASHGTYGKQTLVYIRHEPLRSSSLINPQSLKEYVRWWDTQMSPLLDQKQFALLSVSFIVKNPPAFADYIHQEKIDEIDTKQTVFWLLDEMEHVAKKDLLLFLKTHNIDLPGDRRDKILQKILNKTGGKYEQTIEELKNLRREAWTNEEEESGGKQKAKKDFDY